MPQRLGSAWATCAGVLEGFRGMSGTDQHEPQQVQKRHSEAHDAVFEVPPSAITDKERRRCDRKRVVVCPPSTVPPTRARLISWLYSRTTRTTIIILATPTRMQSPGAKVMHGTVYVNISNFQNNYSGTFPQTHREVPAELSHLPSQAFFHAEGAEATAPHEVSSQIVTMKTSLMVDIVLKTLSMPGLAHQQEYQNTWHRSGTVGGQFRRARSR